MNKKNKRRRTFMEKMFFLVIVLTVSAGIHVQAAEVETSNVIFETGNMEESRTFEMGGIYSQQAIINEETAAATQDETIHAVPEKKYLEDRGNYYAAPGNDLKKDESQNAEVTLYVLDPDYQQYLSIPSGYTQSYSLLGHTYGTVNGSSITISDGTIIPAVEIWYYHQVPDSGYWVGQTTPSGQEGEVVKERYIYKDSSIVIDGKTVTFHICDYAKIYSEQVIEKYLDENIDLSMSDYEKAEICCKFVAGYDYGTESTSYTGLIVTGSGDCWASTNTLLYMFNKLGIKAQSRSASHDPGAGSGHYNVLAILDGYYYIVEAGYNEKAPRNYSLQKYSSSNMPYIYSVISKEEGTICITDYYDFDELTINIPSEIDGYTVTQIGDKAFYATGMAEKIVIPNTVKSIGDQAFAWCEKLKSIEIPNSVVSFGRSVFYNDRCLSSIHIPASVEELTGGMFQSCYSLKEIIVDEKNEYYCSTAGVLFDKPMETLIAYPPGKSDETYNIPEGVVSIGDWAFASCGEYITEQSSVANNGFQKLVLPTSLRTIGEYAFYDIYIKEMLIHNGITVIPSYSFKSADIAKVTLPDSVSVIEPYAFYRASLDEIVLSNGLETIGEAAFAGNLKMKTILPESVQSIGSNAFGLNYGWSSMGSDPTSGFNNYYNGYIACQNVNCPKMEEKAFYGVSLGVAPNSQMQDYAVENGIYYVYIDSNSKCMLKQEWFGEWFYLYGKEDDITYKGTQKAMDAVPYYLKQGIDYTLSYDEGKETAYVEGIGYMAGKITKSLTGTAGTKTDISKAAITLDKNSYLYTGKPITPNVTVTFSGKKLVLGIHYTVSYQNNTQVGTAKVTVTGKGNYKGSTTKTFTICKAKQPITCKKKTYSVVYGTKPFKLNVTSGGSLTYQSSNSKVATVGKTNGKVTIKNTGIAYITAKTETDSVKITIKASPKKLAIKSLSVGKRKKLTVKWLKDKRATGYQIQASTTKNFKKIAKKQNTAKNSYTFTNLKAGKRYYVRLRSYKKSGKNTLYSAWSSPKRSSKIKR